jgi:hypothetical protein
VAFLDLQLVREDVEQDLRIGVGVDVAAIVLEHLAPQRLGVDQGCRYAGARSRTAS